MEKNFRYLRDKHVDAGAREVFEKICVQLMQLKFKEAYPVNVSQVDDGIDIFVGDFSDSIDVYQGKSMKLVSRVLRELDNNHKLLLN